jgi:hypothetical protein
MILYRNIENLPANDPKVKLFNKQLEEEDKALDKAGHHDKLCSITTEFYEEQERLWKEINDNIYMERNMYEP